MIKNINISFCEINEKYDLIIDGIRVGKYYTLDSAIAGIKRGIIVAIHQKSILKPNKTI